MINQVKDIVHTFEYVADGVSGSDLILYMAEMEILLLGKVLLDCAFEALWSCSLGDIQPNTIYGSNRSPEKSFLTACSKRTMVLLTMLIKTNQLGGFCLPNAMDGHGHFGSNRSSEKSFLTTCSKRAMVLLTMLIKTSQLGGFRLPNAMDGHGHLVTWRRALVGSNLMS